MNVGDTVLVNKTFSNCIGLYELNESIEIKNEKGIVTHKDDWVIPYVVELENKELQKILDYYNIRFLEDELILLK